jgi:hypothetical protein
MGHKVLLAKLRRIDFNIKLVIMVFAYLFIADLLSVWLAKSTANALVFFAVSVLSYPILVEGRKRFVKHAIISGLLALAIFTFSRLFTSH